MKRILLAASLILLSCAGVNAQNKTVATNTKQQVTDFKKEFNDKSNEFKTFLNNKDVDNARKTYFSLAALMQRSIGANNQELTNASDKGRAALTEKITLQSTLYRDMKFMSVDLLKNKDAFLEKLNTFQGTL